VDIKAYIASGILEIYALGMTNEEETLEVESLLSTYPELRAELEQIELGLEAFAQEQAIEPPTDLKAKILEEMGLSDSLGKAVEVPAKKQFNYWAFVFILLSIIFGSLMVWFYLQNQESTKEATALEKELKDCNTSKTEELLFAEKSLNKKVWEIYILTNTYTSKIVLSGTEKYPDLNATVYWNKSAKVTYIANTGLPIAAADEDYQLWAIVDGKPVDLGVVGDIDLSTLAEMKFVESPQAFAITLEPKGGSKVPTMENMVTLGALS
jgi:anti-sigma-K factor RskA